MNNNGVHSKNLNKTGKEIFNVKEKLINDSNKIAKNKIAQIKSKKIIQNKKVIKKNNNKLKNNLQRKTFIEMSKTCKPSFINNYMDTIKKNDKYPYFFSFVEKNSYPLDKYIFNKRSILLKNRRHHLKENCTFTNFEKTIKKHSTTFITFNKKEKEYLVNKQTKNNNNIIESYNNKKTYQTNNNPNYVIDITNILPKKSKLSKNNVLNSGKNTKNKNKIIKKENTKVNQDIDIFDIISEHKQSINLMKPENYNVNKPHEYNMKYSFLKEYEDENDSNNNSKEEKNEKIIIGKIEGYKDIIESDKINNKKQSKEKKFPHKNKLNKKTNLIINTDKNNNFFEDYHFLEDNSSEFYELNFANNYCKTNINLENIDNEYEFEDLPTNENDNKTNKNKIKLFNNNKNIYNWQM